MFIFSNLAISLDGKIATWDRSFYPLGTPEDRKQMGVLRKQCDALLIGGSTFRAFKKPSKISGGTHHPINMILSSALEGISPRWEFFKDPEIQRILFVGEKTPASRIKKFASSCEIVTLKKASSKLSTPLQILRFLEMKKIQRLLVEGGGSVMWDFAKQNLIDEYHVTLTPRILGGDQAPTLVDGVGFAPKDILNLKLRQCKIIGDELYLTYGKTDKRGFDGSSFDP